MAYEGDAAEQVIRIALSGGEIALRLTGSLAKNAAAFLLALSKSNKVVHGKKSVKKLLRNTRDLRVFPMSREQFNAFKKKARQQKILYAGVRDKSFKSPTIDLILPMTEVERANIIFDTIGLKPDKEAEASQQEQGNGKKKDSRSQSNSRSTKDKSTSQNKGSKTNKEKPSVTAKLEAFDKIAKQQAAKPKARTRSKGK